MTRSVKSTAALDDCIRPQLPMPQNAIMDGRVPNESLRALLAEAGWNGAELARRVNRVAAEAGLTLTADRRSVSFWLAGRCPRPPVPELVAETFSRGLRRAVDVPDTGMDRHNRAASIADRADLGTGDVRGHTEMNYRSAGFQDPVISLSELARPYGRRQVLAGGAAYSLSLLAVPTWADATARKDPGSQTIPGPRPDKPITSGQLDVVERMAWLFTDNDSVFGGGYARGALAAYLAYDVAPLLRAPAPPALRTRLLSVSTELTYRCGFMCFDDEQQGLAQHYFLIALNLAAHAGDPVAYAITLRAMSVQARSLGHQQHALQLAEAAVVTGRGKLSATRLAFMQGQIAVAAAACQNRTTALRALSSAERRIDRATSRTGPTALAARQVRIGDYHYAALAHQQAAVRALLGDRRGAITSLQDSLRYRPPGERRSRAIITARLAELHMTLGQLDQAVHVWHEFLNDFPYLSSGRASTALNIMRSRLLPHAANSGAKQILARAAAL
jgi:tetratricopeptide (TPR) repeat protein